MSNVCRVDTDTRSSYLITFRVCSGGEVPRKHDGDGAGVARLLPQGPGFLALHSQVKVFPVSVVDPDPFDTDPDNAFHFDTNLEPAFQLDPDPTV